MVQVGVGTLVSGGSTEGRVEAKLKGITGRRFVHLCGSGTAAIMFAFRAMRVPRGSQVLMPALLCVNPGSATVYAGCRLRHTCDRGETELLAGDQSRRGEA